MRFNLTRTTALAVLTQALKTCNTKAKGEADSEFLFQHKDGDLYVTSLNDTAEQTIKLPTYDLEVEDVESFSVAGSAIVEFLRQFPDEDIVCAYIAEESAFVAGSTVRKSKFAFVTGDPNDFIPINFLPQGQHFVVKSDHLSAALRSTAFAAAKDFAKAPFIAVKLKLEGGELVAEATDESRISVYSVEVEEDAVSGEFLLPREAADSLSGMLEHVDEVEVHPGARHLRLIWDGTVFTSSLVNAGGKPFPNLSGLLKCKELGRVKISRGDLLRALKMASQFARDSYVKVAITPDGFEISTAESIGASEDTVVTQQSEGEGETYVACKLFMSGVESTTEPWIEIVMGELSNGTVALTLEEGNYKHLVFPVLPKNLEEESDAQDESDEDEE